MMSFDVHSVLGLAPNLSTMDIPSSINYSFDLLHHHHQPPCDYGLGMITATAVPATSGSVHNHIDQPLPYNKATDDDGSSLSKLLLPPPQPTPPLLQPALSLPTMLTKKDPGGIGFIDDIGGGVDGLMSCTESLGFESSDERTVDDKIDLEETTKTMVSRRKVEEKRESVDHHQQKKNKKKFPPPLTSLNQNGKPSFFLRPVRKDGRLELTEVRIDRPRILHASRQDGRLRLHLIRNHDDDEHEDQDRGEKMEKDGEQEEEIIEEENEEKIDQEWKLEEFKRHNKNNHPHQHHHEYLPHHDDHYHHHHNFHVWRQPCVTTR